MANLGKILKTVGKIVVVAGPPILAASEELKKTGNCKVAAEKALKRLV